METIICADLLFYKCIFILGQNLDPSSNNYNDTGRTKLSYATVLLYQH